MSRWAHRRPNGECAGLPKCFGWCERQPGLSRCVPSFTAVIGELLTFHSSNPPMPGTSFLILLYAFVAAVASCNVPYQRSVLPSTTKFPPHPESVLEVHVPLSGKPRMLPVLVKVTHSVPVFSCVGPL